MDKQVHKVPNPQWIVPTLWITYAAFYLGRVNISPVLENIALDLEVTRAQVGMLGTVFFWVYALGMLIIGEIGTHISPRIIVAIGLLVIIITNLAFSWQMSLWMMAILWGINGFAQASGWAPMLRIIAERFDYEQTKRISTIMPFSYVVGTAVTWTVIGLITASGQWRIAFSLPGALLIVVLAFWWLTGVDAPKSEVSNFSISDMLSEISTLWHILIAAGLTGFIYIGSLIWLPAYVESSQLIPDTLIGFIAAIMQVIALSGIFMAQQLVKTSGQVIMTTVKLLIMTAIILLIAMMTNGIYTLLAVTVALITLNGAVGMVVSSVPVVLSKTGRTSSVTGTVNAVSSLGGGFAGFGLGFLIDNYGWNPVFLSWIVCAVFAAMLLWGNRQHENQLEVIN